MSFFSKLFGKKPNKELNQQSVEKELDLSVLHRSNDFHNSMIDDRYEVIEVKKGGLGAVFLCLDRQTDSPIALKTFQNQFLADRVVRDDFLRECNTWINLGRHPHVVRAHRVELIGNEEVYLALDWIPTPHNKQDASLQAWIKPNKPLSVVQTLAFALHISRGMEYATTKIPGLVHRDLKPDNILVGEDGLARVTDFGLAVTVFQKNIKVSKQKNMGPSHTQLIQDGIAGTPLYMAPEQWIIGEIVDQRADIYAFGCILYELLTGRNVVTGRDIDELAEAHLTGNIGGLPRNLPNEVSTLVRRCLATQRQHRFENWHDTEIAIARAYKKFTGKDAPQAMSGDTETQLDRLAAGWSCYAIGYSYHNIGKYDAAIEYFEKMTEIGRTEKDLALIGVGFHYLGLVYASKGDASLSVRFSNEAFNILQQTDHLHLMGSTLGNLGNGYRNLGEMQKAIEFYELAMDIANQIDEPGLEGKVSNSLGNAYRRVGRIQRAIELYENALRINRSMGDQRGAATVLGNIGIAYRNMGNPQKAIEFYKQALHTQQKIGDRAGEGRAFGNLGNAYSDLGDFQKAAALIEQALAIAREIKDEQAEATGLDSLGIVLTELDRVEEAKTLHLQSLSISKKIGDLLGAARVSRNYAILLLKSGEVIDALDYADFAAQAFEQVGHTELAQKTRQLIDGLGIKTKVDEYWERGDSYFGQGRLDDAIREYKAVLEITPDNFAVRYNLGNAFALAGRLNDAIREYQAAIHPNFAEPHFSLGRIYLSQGQVNDAIREFNAAIKIDPRMESAYLHLGALYEQQGGLNLAIQKFKAMLPNQKNNPIIHSFLGDFYRRQERYDAAIKELRIAVRLAPDDAEAHLLLGVVYMSTELWDQAIEEHQISLRLNPDEAGAYNNLALIYRQQGRLDKAIQAAEMAVKLEYPEAEKLLAQLKRTARHGGARSFR